MESFWRDLFRDMCLCKEASMGLNDEHCHAVSFDLGERSPATNVVSCSLARWIFCSDGCSARLSLGLPAQSGWSWLRDRPGCAWGMLAHQPDPSPTWLNSQSCSRSYGKAVLQSAVGDKVLSSPVFLGTPAGWAHGERVRVIYARGIFCAALGGPCLPASALQFTRNSTEFVSLLEA